MENSDAYKIPGLLSLSDPLVAISVVLSDYNISFAEVCKKTRRRDILKYRQIVHTVLSRHTGLSMTEIGNRVGCKDHATVIHSKRVISASEYVYRKHMVKEELLVLYTEIERKYLKLTVRIN